MFKLIEANWCKRRAPTKKPLVVRFEVVDFKKIDLHKCSMNVWYDDETMRTLEATVNISKIYVLGKKEAIPVRCTVYGYDNGVDSVMVELVE